MKSFQQNLLIAVALGLCGLCVCQWYGQTAQRAEIARLTELLYDKSAAIQAYTNSISTMDRQVARMDLGLAELKTAAATNAALVITQRRELSRLLATADGLTNQIIEYKAALESVQAKLKQAYDGIQKQNDALQEMVAQRDALVQKFNDGVKERNELVAKYNDLAARVEKLQATRP